MKRAVTNRNRRRAFTLLEVLMVIVILGVLAALIVPQFAGTGDKAKRDLTAAQIEGLGNDLERFKMHCDRYPTTDEGLAALLTKPDAEELATKWGGPYIKKPAVDAWSNPLEYRSPGQYNEGSYDLWSRGPNGQEGDDDDITNWKKE
ncbi:MAG: type II secretion system major pseudopilin GspG [Phycisphaerales bacterium]|nr:type II secretion system major pseudopilin GspG [Phycisphaerales bacterium]